ncbi:tyrosine-type recombinase/integrase [Pectobacterium aroidearum]|uniref:tyrosine-type recombinase/integrase n=1 Tax=Pectobacterium aroidearum TaxID=1201031 RepID=UPI002A7EE1F2|nr:tyrosine-type recombinase/integrase [Pectobacterium aroidearum]MDY4387852.1 integrase [Pectobacterium aroidearum]
MGRNRIDPADNKLPLRVTKNKYSYVFKPAGTKETITLGRIKDLTIAQVWSKYESVINSRADVMTFSKLWNFFLDSEYFKDLSQRTQSDYLQHQKKLLHAFGNAKADSIKPEHVRRFMDLRGKKSRTQANQEKSSMSRAFRWGYERGYVKSNPCIGVSKFSVKARDVYIDDAVYLAIYDEATTALKCAMEISYLCATRIGDVQDLEWWQETDLGLFVQQGKTGVKQIKTYSDRLRAALELARSLGGRRHIIVNKFGEKYSYKGLNTLWVNARRKASVKLGVDLACHFHDIKAKAISDYEGSSRDKQLFSGHKTETQVITYDRKTKISPTLNLPVLEN